MSISAKSNVGSSPACSAGPSSPRFIVKSSSCGASSISPRPFSPAASAGVVSSRRISAVRVATFPVSGSSSRENSISRLVSSSMSMTASSVSNSISPATPSGASGSALAASNRRKRGDSILVAVPLGSPASSLISLPHLPQVFTRSKEIKPHFGQRIILAFAESHCRHSSYPCTQPENGSPFNCRIIAHAIIKNQGTISRNHTIILKISPLQKKTAIAERNNRSLSFLLQATSP
ncbi:hypothetical protein BMS3Abin13_01548 [bacterium BMS3Abin13]|nr:hypothetical protein BMS3Abin13_01548 [bacterium BMS3Abin13]